MLLASPCCTPSLALNALLFALLVARPCLAFKSLLRALLARPCLSFLCTSFPSLHALATPSACTPSMLHAHLVAHFCSHAFICPPSLLFARLLLHDLAPSLLLVDSIKLLLARSCLHALLACRPSCLHVLTARPCLLCTHCCTLLLSGQHGRGSGGPRGEATESGAGARGGCYSDDRQLRQFYLQHRTGNTTYRVNPANLVCCHPVT
jgi:hypothetical protein